MRKWMLAAGAAALAIGAPALAQGNGHGGGHGGGGGGGQKADRGPAKADQGNRGGGANRGPQMNNRKVERTVERGGGNDRGPAMRGNGNGNGNRDRVVVRNDNGNGRGNGNGNAKADFKANGNARNDIRVVEAVRDDGRRIVRNFESPLFGRGVYDGCPPGLAKKDNGCLPPGQAMKLVGAPLQASFANTLVPYQYRSWYRDNDQYYYRYGDDYIYRIGRNNNLVDGLIPLFGTGYYAMGDPWPQPYDFYNVPYQYRSYYPDSSDYYYRYGDGAIYQLDAKTSAVSSIVALLAGDLGVGSRLPLGYNTYNVPFAYRDRYYDTPNDWYRYNDGYIYRVDPTTRLITAVIDAIV